MAAICALLLVGASVALPAPVAARSEPSRSRAGPAVRADRPRVFVMHDSIMYAASDNLRTSLADHEVNFSGWPGYTVSYAPDLVVRQRYLIDDVVVVSLGTNYLRDPDRFRRGVRDTMVVLDSVDRVIWITPQVYRPDINDVLDILEAESRRFPNLELLDWTSVVADRPTLTRPGDVHLTTAGEAVFAGLIADAVRGGARYDHAPVGRMKVRARRPGVVVQGWALDPIDRVPADVRVIVDGEVMAQVAAGDRPAYRTRLALPNGRHQICVEALDAGEGRDRVLGCQVVRTANDPVGSIGVAQVGGDRLTMNGWVMDPDGRRPLAIDVIVDGETRIETTADRIRRDVETRFDNGHRHGFRVDLALDAGVHEVCVRGRNIFAGADREVDCRLVEAP